MIDIATWRARIGLFNLSTGGRPGKRAGPVLRAASSTEEWSLLLALTTSVVEVVTVIIILLMLAGDVERNPGPGKGEDISYTAGSCMVD